MATPFPIIKRQENGQDIAYTNYFSGAWRRITDPQNIPDWGNIAPISEADFNKIYRGTVAGDYNWNTAMSQYNYLQQKDTAPPPPPPPDPNKFRPRDEGESLTSYLQAKQAYEMAKTGTSAISFGGTAPTAPIASTVTPTAPTASTTEAPEDTARSKSGEYYKIGNDVFSSATNQKIELEEFKKQGLNFALLPEGKYYKSGNDVYAPDGRKIDQMEFQKLGLNFALLPEGTAPATPITTPTPTPITTIPNLRNQAISELNKIGYANPDEGEIQGMIEALSKGTGGTAPTGTAPTAPTAPTGETQKQYVRYAGSPDVFDRTNGKYISADEASRIPGFDAQVEDLSSIRPDIKTEADFARLNQTNLQMQNYGVMTTAEDFNTNPLKAFMETYQQIWNTLGLTDLKTSYQQLADEKAEKIADVNDNPWLSEAERSRRITKLDTKYDEKLKTTLALFEAGQKEAQFVTSNALESYYKEKTFDQQVLLKQMDLAEQLADSYKSVKEVRGGLFDLKTGEWIVAPKAETGGSVVDERKWREDIAEELATIKNFSSREEALNELSKNSTALSVKLGEDGLNLLQAEVDRLFPVMPPPVPITAREFGQQVGSGARIIGSALSPSGIAGGFEEITKTLGSFLGGIFGK